MKTIIKYELVINEALRSALNYNTPDEQINEFIRFFGRHIGSDRTAENLCGAPALQRAPGQPGVCGGQAPAEIPGLFSGCQQ